MEKLQLLLENLVLRLQVLAGGPSGAGAEPKFAVAGGGGGDGVVAAAAYADVVGVAGVVSEKKLVTADGREDGEDFVVVLSGLLLVAADGESTDAAAVQDDDGRDQSWEARETYDHEPARRCEPDSDAAGFHPPQTGALL
ncbi:unnamed protein product [Sphagnum balticum]